MLCFQSPVGNQKYHIIEALYNKVDLCPTVVKVPHLRLSFTFGDGFLFSRDSVFIPLDLGYINIQSVLHFGEILLLHWKPLEIILYTKNVSKHMVI